MLKRSSKPAETTNAQSLPKLSFVGNKRKPNKTHKPKKNPHASALGKLGGPKGGRARAENLSPERRSEIASKAARTRWGKS